MEDEELSNKLAQYQEKGVTKVKLGLTDIDGVIRGKYVSLDKFTGLMRKHGSVERWAGMEMVDSGPFLEAVIGKAPGGLVYEVRDHTMAERSGIRPGDIIAMVNNIPANNGSGARRLLGRMALSKPKFNVTFIRGFVEAPPTTIFKRRPGGGGR